MNAIATAAPAIFLIKISALGGEKALEFVCNVYDFNVDRAMAGPERFLLRHLKPKQRCFVLASDTLHYSNARLPRGSWRAQNQLRWLHFPPGAVNELETHPTKGSLCAGAKKLGYWVHPANDEKSGVSIAKHLVFSLS